MMKHFQTIALLLSATLLIVLSACGTQKQPVGNFQTLECQTICKGTSCTQQCVEAKGHYYKK
ncbi:hypothetical protein [Helicobacter sp. MIT 05-5293]|uniref:hypothetical protein n=1 Tax=Helicobacter sp. MIT 05-5293 TaxID=1548149 RepID=UPI000690B58E|nr:hypothetical protein [Helicobacter sp. MIT 05-5293]